MWIAKVEGGTRPLKNKASFWLRGQNVG